jgi:sugar lactone lactonase YvrE
MNHRFTEISKWVGRTIGLVGATGVLLLSACGGVTTDSGTGDLGGGAAQGVDPSAQFANPFSTATDGANTVYVADTSNQTIRAIDLTTGKVTGLAGKNGAFGTDDGIGESARFNLPKGLVVVGPHLFVADSANFTIRKIVRATGAVTTVAGSPGLPGSDDGVGPAARFGSPKALAADGDDVLYVADAFNNTIRRFTLSTGEVATVVGPAAGLSTPQGLAVNDQYVYVSDTDHHVILQVEKLTGTVSVLAGRDRISGAADGDGAVATFFQPHGMALSGTQLYVCDSGNHTIRRIDLSGAAYPVSTVAGQAGVSGSADGVGTQARFNMPLGLSTDGTRLFVADTFSSVVKQITLATGNVTTLDGRIPL